MNSMEQEKWKIIEHLDKIMLVHHSIQFQALVQMELLFTINPKKILLLN